ncbi:hypothetical protein MVES_002600 [Malassezia vespertilionis]|uniref:Inhibitor I9 domain-containing protein n=1 Tax=Malassezia vespertilionis TaxID=2020962 RepID=A0A2N1JAP6_9BASI|nr:hypothetical protein MVES_002600 [Malassezia vespertilionis]
MTTKPFVLMFKASAPASEIDNYVAEVTKRGGTIRQRFNADFLRGFSAQIPSEYADSFTNKSEVMEPDHEVRVNN